MRINLKADSPMNIHKADRQIDLLIDWNLGTCEEY